MKFHTNPSQIFICFSTPTFDIEQPLLHETILGKVSPSRIDEMSKLI